MKFYFREKKDVITKKGLFLGLPLFFFFLSGCTSVSEPFKVMWGSSTRALEQARDQAISKTYLCDYDACFDRVLKVAKEQKYVVFINDRLKEHIVVMGILGSVNTTEVGIFFNELKKSQITIDVASLSSSAKEKVSKAIFDGLDQEFKEQN